MRSWVTSSGGFSEQKYTVPFIVGSIWPGLGGKNIWGRGQSKSREATWGLQFVPSCFQGYQCRTVPCTLHNYIIMMRYNCIIFYYVKSMCFSASYKKGWNISTDICNKQHIYSRLLKVHESKWKNSKTSVCINKIWHYLWRHCLIMVWTRSWVVRNYGSRIHALAVSSKLIKLQGSAWLSTGRLFVRHLVTRWQNRCSNSEHCECKRIVIWRDCLPQRNLTCEKLSRYWGSPWNDRIMSDE